jgi:hypothetical protein
MRLTAALAMLALLPLAALPARSADEPEVVYGKFHRAVMAGDLVEMFKHGPAQRRAELQGMSAARKEATLKLAQFMMPRAFRLEQRTLHSGGRATLVVSGTGDMGPKGLETMYGIVTMLQERGEWKVDEANWSNDRPANLGAAKPAAKSTAAPKAASGARGAPMVGTPMATPVRTLGEAKPPCVYKPVMTAADMEACK